MPPEWRRCLKHYARCGLVRPLAHDVIVLFSDGEESGLAGAAAFVREHPWARDVAFILNFEGRGTRGLSMMFETGAGNLDAVRVLRQVPECCCQLALGDGIPRITE